MNKIFWAKNICNKYSKINKNKQFFKFYGADSFLWSRHLKKLLKLKNKQFFKVYGAVITFKKINEIKQNEKKILKFEIFYENHPPRRHIKYKRIDFATCIISLMANKTARIRAKP